MPLPPRVALRVLVWSCLPALAAAGCAGSFGGSARAPAAAASIESDVLGPGMVGPAAQELMVAQRNELIGERLQVASGGAETEIISRVGPDSASQPARLEAGARRSGSNLLVVTGTLEVAVDDVAAAAQSVRALIEGLGGSITTDSLLSERGSARGRLIVRIPPGTVDGLLARLAEIGRIESRRIDSADVSKEYFDQELAIKNLEITSGRLQALLERQAGSLKDVVEIERELTRVRGELERLKGAQRYLRDRIALATLQIDLNGRALLPATQSHAKFQLAPHGSTLNLAAGALAPRQRWGGGVAVLFSRLVSLELDLYRGPEGRDAGYLVTLGSAVYSDLLGGGQRRFLNPYLGLRLGGGSFDDRGAWAAAAEVGLELYRGRILTIECAGRAWALHFPANDGPGDVGALQAIAGLAVPF